MIRPRSQQGPAAVAAHYDSLDKFYREIWGHHVHHGFWVDGTESPAEATERLSWHVIEKAGIRTGDSVVDVGCGYGGTSGLIAEHFSANVVGFTLSATQRAFAESRPVARGRVAVHARDWLANGLPSGSVDAVVSIECVSHVEDKAAFYEEIQRVLRPGGRAVICAWLANETAGPRAERLLLEPICREGRLAGLATNQEHRGWISAAGLTLIEEEDVSRMVAKTWSVVIRRVLVSLVRRPAYLRFLFSRHAADRIFFLTLFRLWLGYRTGALRYGIFTCAAPGR